MKQSTSYALTVMLLLAGIIILIAGFPVDEGVKMLSKGIGSQASTLVLLLNFTVMMDLVNAGEGFTALGNLLSGLAQSGGATALALVSAVVGGFGIETAAVLEIQIVAEMFGEMAIKAGLPMGVFAVSILAATRLTSSVYPTSNFYRSDDHRPLRQHEGSSSCQTGLVPLLHGLSFYFMLSSVQ